MNAPTSPPPGPARFAAARVAPNAAHAFGGVWRLTSRRYATLSHWLFVAGALAALALLAVGAAQGQDERNRYVDWMARLYCCFLVPLLAFISGGGAMRDDQKTDAVDYVFTRPVRRSTYVFFRYVSHVVCTQFDFLLALAVVTLVGFACNAPGVVAALPRLFLAQVIVIVACTAFGFLAGALTSRYVIIGLLWGAIIEVGVGAIQTQLSRLSMIRQVFGLLAPVTGVEPAVTVLSPLATVALLGGFAAVMVAAAAALFAAKELAGASGREI